MKIKDKINLSLTGLMACILLLLLLVAGFFYPGHISSDVFFWLISGYIFTISVIFIAGNFLVGRFMSPVEQITEDMDSIYPKNLERRLTVSEEDELGKLAAAFNRLLDRIEGAFQLQQTFISNFSHELKNPLMKMVSQLEMSILKERKPAEYEGIIRSVLEDLIELGHLSDTLLELAKVGDQSKDLIPATVRVDELLFDAREFLIESQKGCKILIDYQGSMFTEEQLTVIGNAHLLRTAFVNIIENGCKFSYDGQVLVRCGVEKNDVCISIRNRGFGIKERDIPHLFDPFFRAENTAAFKGYGIGLPLVHRIIKHHRGLIEVNSVENEETNFIIRIPIATP